MMRIGIHAKTFQPIATLSEKPVSLDHAERLSENLASLEQKLGKLKTLVNSNKLIESQRLSREVKALSKQINSAWLTIQDEIAESQRLIDSLHGLSLLRSDGRPVKLKELKSVTLALRSMRCFSGS